MSDIKTLDEILEKFGLKAFTSFDGSRYSEAKRKAKQSLNLYIEGKMKEARLDELKHIDDPANVRLWFDGYYGVKERIKELEG